MMRNLRIGIVGGSLAGLFAGVILGRDGHHVRVYERSPSGFGGRGAGLVPQQEVFDLLREIGIEHLSEFGVLALDRLYLDRSGAIVERARTPQTNISWDVLYSTVAAKLGSERYSLGRQVVNVTEDADVSVIEFDDGSVESVDLVIGADGISSVVRRVLNREHQNRYSGYVAWRGLVPETHLAGAAASVLPGNFTFYVAPGNHALGYLVPGPEGEIAAGERRYNWVWYRFVDSYDLPNLFRGRSGTLFTYSLPRGELSDERRSTLRADAVRLLPPPFAEAVKTEPFPSIQGIFDYEARHMVGKRTALIGDAAFVVRPHTAMGVSKAAGDVMSLRNNLRRGASLVDALQAFESERREIGHRIAEYGRRLGASSMV